MLKSVGHISKEDFKKTMQKLHHLKTNSIYMLDIFNFNAPLQKKLSKLIIKWVKLFFKSQVSVIDKENRLFISYDNYKIQKNG
jgi:hypothetical protein